MDKKKTECKTCGARFVNFKLQDLEKILPYRPEGYLTDILEGATIIGKYLVITTNRYNFLCKKYARSPRFR